MSEPSSGGHSSPPPVKKLKQSTLTFVNDTSMQLDTSIPSTSNSEATDFSDLNHEYISISLPDEDIACASECSAHVCDEQGLIPFQSKDPSTIEHTR